MLGTLVTLAALAAAEGGTWTTTFEKAAVGSYVPQAGARLLVAAGGDDRAATQPAAAALQQALRASGRTQLVMDDQGLGALAGLDDAAIVARAAKLPVDGVMVIRVFPGGPGAPATAVVTSYDPKGAVQVAFSAQQGQALARREGATEVAQGVSQAAVATVDSMTKSARAWRWGRGACSNRSSTCRPTDPPATTVDGKMVGSGPTVVVPGRAGPHEVFAVIGGRMWPGDRRDAARRKVTRRPRLPRASPVARESPHEPGSRM